MNIVDRLGQYLGNIFEDYRDDILGDSYNWGPILTPSAVKYLVYHHSVTAQTAKDDGNWKAECDRIASIHVNGNGWKGIGYRFVITSDGKIVYVGDLNRGGSAVANMNDVCISVCLVGDFTKVLPTASQVHSAHLLAKFFLTQTPEYIQLNGFEDVVGHKELNPTGCPGSAWKVEGDSLYSRIVDDRWQGYPLPEPSMPQPPIDPCLIYKEELVKVKAELESAQQKLDQIKSILA